jgi:hypothetical protein
MASHRYAQLLLRRQRLIARSAELRVTFARQAQVLAPPLALADRSLSALNWLRRHPVWPLGLLLLGVVARPRAILRWAGRLWWGWTLLQRLRSPLNAVTWRRS